MLSNSFSSISTFANIHRLYKSVRGVCCYDTFLLFTSPKTVVYMYSSHSTLDCPSSKMYRHKLTQTWFRWIFSFDPKPQSIRFSIRDEDIGSQKSWVSIGSMNVKGEIKNDARGHGKKLEMDKRETSGRDRAMKVVCIVWTMDG